MKKQTTTMETPVNKSREDVRKQGSNKNSVVKKASTAQRKQEEGAKYQVSKQKSDEFSEKSPEKANEELRVSDIEKG